MSAHASALTLVAGIGSPHGADRLGWAVIEALQGCALSPEVRLLACRLPAELTPLLLETPRVIVVDALLGSGPPGRVHVLKAADLPHAPLRLSSHGAGLADAVQLASALGMPQERLTVLALDVVNADAALLPAWVDTLAQAVLASLANGYASR